MITGLLLRGHDSELFSFLPEVYIEQLKKHSQAPLWTFGTVDQEGLLRSMTYWNGRGCLIFSSPPVKSVEDGWSNYRGFVTDDGLQQVNALTIVRYLFCQGYVSCLDQVPWTAAADPQLERLAYIRNWSGKSRVSPGWSDLLCRYFDWTCAALESVRVRCPAWAASRDGEAIADCDSADRASGETASCPAAGPAVAGPAPQTSELGR